MAPKTIKGKAAIPGFNTDADVDVTDDQYEAYDKGLPKDLPKDFNGETITWFNNFGVRRKNSTSEEKFLPKYMVFLQKLPEDKKLCAYYKGEVHDIRVESAGAGRVVFTLDVGDPPVGFYP